MADAAAGGAAPDAGAGGNGDGGPSGVCPATPPPAGSACAAAVGPCSWGSEPRDDCRTVGTCKEGAWTLTAPKDYCAAPRPAACPAAPATGVCSGSLTCLYDQTTRCSCVPCKCLPGPPGPPCPRCDGHPVGTPVWFCERPPALYPPCPSVLPNEGTACTEEGMSCPATACYQTIADCKGGRWTWRFGLNCPVCASPDTPIATPAGDRPIAELRVGDLVYTVENEAIVAAPLVRVGQTPVAHHQVMRVRLAGGRTLEISAGHPTADGRTFGDLRPGALLDGVPVQAAELVPYRHTQTYDILPASRSGDYFAAGLRIGSTLAPR